MRRPLSLVPALVLVLVLVLALAAPLAVPVHAAELAGVTLPDSVQVDGSTLALNGIGLREKFFIDVYVAGLYLPTKTRSGDKVLAADTARQTIMQFVFGVDKGKICDAWKESLEANVPDASPELAKDFDTLCGWMDDMADGDQMTYTYVPGTGTTVNVKGKDQGTIEGKAFADALFASWIGKHPATDKLRKGLLGG